MSEYVTEDGQRGVLGRGEEVFLQQRYCWNQDEGTFQDQQPHKGVSVGFFFS